MISPLPGHSVSRQLQFELTVFQRACFASAIKVPNSPSNMEHLNATDQNNTVVNPEQFVLSAVTVMNLLAQMEWRAIGLVILASILVSLVDGHGRLFDPPSRSTAWRVGFDTPKDYNDMEGFCGGFDRQWLVNSGRCGVCGDPYDEVIKPHEAPGGVFATGTIVRNYIQGQIIPVTIQITATHRGFYEFRLCPNNNPQKDPTQDCFEKYPLNFVDGTGTTTTKFSLENLSAATYQIQIQLPSEVTCSQCVIQWTYVTGNRWGVCPDETSRLGCGPQESFRACSDVAISPIGGSSSTTTSTVPFPVTTTRPVPSQTPTSTTGIQPTTIQMITATPSVPVTSVAVTNPSTVTLLLTRPPSIFTTTKRPNRPLRPVRPGRPTRPTRPTIRPTTPNGSNPAGVFTMSPILGAFTRPPFQPVTRPTPLPPKPKPTSLKPTSINTTTGKPIPAPASVGNGECTNYIPVSAQNTMSGMTAWCNNNCRLGYCPSDFCKCSE